MRAAFLIRVLFLGLVVVAGVAGLVTWWGDSDSDYIPVPYVRPVNAQTTLDWQPEHRSIPGPKSDPTAHPGFPLATVHCGRCHEVPDPGQLPRSTWPFVLTWMSNYLGYTNTYRPFGNNVEGSLVPATRLVGEADFQDLAEYYLLHAPTAAELAGRSGAMRTQTDRFEAWVPPMMTLPPAELITLVHFDSQQGRYYLGRANHRALQVFDANGTLLMNKAAASEPVGVRPFENGFQMTVMGNFWENSNAGAVWDVELGSQGDVQSAELVTAYPRLTESHVADLDADGRKDLLLVGFGAGVEGRVSVRWGPVPAETAETVLLDHSGGLNACLHDFDGNGLVDILLLTAQVKQELWLHLNQGERRFESRLVHQASVGFGYNHVTIGDLNSDGEMDVVLTNGNNMEIRNAPLKPYHGVRVLENQGDLTFEESYFYPLFGALKSVVADFDRDGDDDIAAIAFYPNWKVENPETFVWLQNVSGQEFQPWGLKAEDSGRWISLAAADVDRDGWDDLLLGGGYVPLGVPDEDREHFAQWSAQKPSFMVLRNAGKSEPGDRGLED